MQRLWRIRFVPAYLVIGVATGFAQSAQDLPSAPSAVVQQRSAPPKPAPAQPPQETPAPEVKASNEVESRETPGTSDPGGIKIVVPVNEVNVVFTVTDKHNHYVKDLTQGDFRVIDNEKPVETIRSFRRETDLPLQVGLLIDASNSIRDRFKFEQESAIEFLNETIRPRYDQAFVIGFDDKPELTQDFTDNMEALSKGVRMLRPGGGTALYDALFYAARDKLLKSPQAGSVRRAVILVSDGEDNNSHTTREEAIEMALRANVIVYTISTNFPGGGGSDKYDKILERIADATGGRAFRPFQLTDVADAFSQIQDDLRSQYALSYHPSEFAHDGRYRTIEIMANRKGLKVHSRNGYYAPAE